MFDTHMKAHRRVCAYTGSCDESVSEMGAVAIGCPRAPLRSSSNLLRNCRVCSSFVFHNHVTTCFIVFEATDRNTCKHYCIDHYEYGLKSSTTQNSSITTAFDLDRAADEFEEADDYTVRRDENDAENKRRTAGFMAIISSCNVIIGWNESVRSEGMRRNTYYLLKFLHLGGILPSAAAYDSACTFVAYFKKQYHVSLNNNLPKMSITLSD